MMPTDFSIKVSGPLKLSTANGKEIHLPTQRTQAILGYLAIEGGERTNRATLATLLWGDRGEDQRAHPSDKNCRSSRKRWLQTHLI